VILQTRVSVVLASLNSAIHSTVSFGFPKQNADNCCLRNYCNS